MITVPLDKDLNRTTSDLDFVTFVLFVVTKWLTTKDAKHTKKEMPLEVFASLRELSSLISDVRPLISGSQLSSAMRQVVVSRPCRRNKNSVSAAKRTSFLWTIWPVWPDSCLRKSAVNSPQPISDY